MFGIIVYCHGYGEFERWIDPPFSTALLWLSTSGSTWYGMDWAFMGSGLGVAPSFSKSFHRYGVSFLVIVLLGSASS